MNLLPFHAETRRPILAPRQRILQGDEYWVLASVEARCPAEPQRATAIATLGMAFSTCSTLRTMF